MSKMNVKCLLQNQTLNFKPQLQSPAQILKGPASSFNGLALNSKLQNHQQVAWNCKICQASRKGDERTE